MRNKEMLLAAAVFASALLFLSCESIRFYDLEVEENPSSYARTSVIYKSPLFGKGYVDWDGFRLTKVKSLDNVSGVTIVGVGVKKKSVGARYEFSAGSHTMFPVQVAYFAEVNEVNNLTTEHGRSSLVLGEPPAEIFMEPKGTYLEVETPLPIRVEQLTGHAYKTHVFTGVDSSSTGARIYVSGHEYAVLDFTGKSVLRKKDFPLMLSDSERNFVSALILSMFVYQKELEATGNVTKSAMSIRNGDRTTTVH